MSDTESAIPVATAAPAAPKSYDWQGIVDDLNRLLRLRATPVGLKRFETVEAMEAVERVRRPPMKHALDQIVAQARWLNFTIGITAEDLIGAQCAAPVGLWPDLAEWRARTTMSGVWFASDEDAIAALGPLGSEQPQLEDGLVRVSLRERRGAIVEAVRQLDRHNVAIDDISLRRPTLDDVFLTLTGRVAESSEGDESNDAEAVE